MNKLYDELDKLDEKLKRTGSYDLDKEPCFAELSINECSALKKKNCYECKFYKPLKSQIEVVVKEINSYKNLIPNGTLKTLVGQARAGDLEGAREGLKKNKNMRAL